MFCRIATDAEHDEENLVVHRGRLAFVVLNLYPYISGHLMVVPYLHTGEFASTPKEITDEMMDLAKRAQAALHETYSPAGFNLGMNLGAAAGAGVVDHIHIHILAHKDSTKWVVLLRGGLHEVILR